MSDLYPLKVNKAHHIHASASKKFDAACLKTERAGSNIDSLMFSPIQTPDGKFAIEKPDPNAGRGKAARVSAVEEMKKAENLLSM